MKGFHLVVVALLACACASTNKEPPPKPFAATKWQLVMEIPLAGELPYVRFGDGRMEGFGGCSRFASRYIQDAVGARAIAIGRIEVDRRLCDRIPQVAESRMLEVLQSVSSYSITADVMKMSGSGGTLTFNAVAEAIASATVPAAAARSSTSLTGTRWKGVVESGVDEGSTPWLEFVEGRVAGYTGCNMLSGPWRMEGSEVRLGPLVTTKRGCPGAGGEVEKRVLSVVNDRARVTREGSRLIATAPGGERFEFSEVR
ncbi:MAG: META domain-containing protein [Burkholderiales bacterium]|nr:META domain-containing protein [Burkholderiales bacterium]